MDVNFPIPNAPSLKTIKIINDLTTENKLLEVDKTVDSGNSNNKLSSFESELLLKSEKFTKNMMIYEINNTNICKCN